MNSTLENSLDEKLSAIRAELSNYDSLTRVALFNQCINQKLKNTLSKYAIDTAHLSEYLLQQAGMRVLKAITKINKYADKEVIYNNMKGDQDDKYSK